jgi:hypothetical protein
MAFHYTGAGWRVTRSGKRCGHFLIGSRKDILPLQASFRLISGKDTHSLQPPNQGCPIILVGVKSCLPDYTLILRGLKLTSDGEPYYSHLLFAQYPSFLYVYNFPLKLFIQASKD